MILYFQPQDTTNNLSDPASWSLDSGDYNPAGQTPGGGDNVYLPVAPSTGTLICATADVAGTVYLGSGFEIFCNAVTLESGAVLNGATVIGVVYANANTIGGLLASTTLYSSNCTFYGDIQGPVYDDGSSNTDGGTFTNSITTPTFQNGGTVSGGVITCSSISSGTFNSSASIHQSGGVNLTGCVIDPSCSISWSNITSLNVQVGGSSGAIAYASWPAPDYIATAAGGTLVLPAVGDVRTGVTYGISGNGATGSMPAGLTPRIGSTMISRG